MRRTVCGVVASMFLVGCHEGPHYTQPTTIDLPSVPARITVTALPGTGTAAGDIYIAARVFDAQGRGVGSTAVTFSTNVGTVAPNSVLSDGGGLAQTTVKTSQTANLRVAAGSALATMDVTPTAPIAPLPPVDPTFPPPVPTPPPSTPQPAPPPTPTPTPPAPIPPAGLQVTMGCTTAALVVSCNLAASYNGVPLQSTPPTFTQVDWDWGDGQSQVVPGSPLGAHTYTQAGTYTIVPHVTVLTIDGSKTASTSTSIKIP